jgi:hypothetical protein
MKTNLRELRYVLAALLVWASLLRGSAAHAMEIEKFDKMDGRDQSEYIVALIEGAQQVLIKEGKKELAAKIHPLFTTTLPGDQSPVGVVESFETHADGLAKIPPALRELFSRLDALYRQSVGPQRRSG